MNQYQGISSAVKSVMTAFDNYDPERPVTYGELEIILTNVLSTYFKSDDFKSSIRTDISASSSK